MNMKGQSNSDSIVEFPKEDGEEDGSSQMQLYANGENCIALLGVDGKNLKRKSVHHLQSDNLSMEHSKVCKRQRTGCDEVLLSSNAIVVRTENPFGQFCIGYFPAKAEEASPSMPAKYK